MSRFFRFRMKYSDVAMLCAIFFLLVFGLVMLYSVSTYDANITFGYGNYYLMKQLKATGLGIVAMMIVSRINYHIYDRFSIPIWIVACFTVLLVLTPLGVEANGARRWINVGISIQPAEIAKVAVIILVASVGIHLGRSMNTAWGMGIVLGIIIITSGIIALATNNVSSAFIVASIAVAMYYVMVPGNFLFISGVVGIGSALIAARFIVLSGILEQIPKASFRIKRIIAWVNPQADSSDYGFQTLQSLYAIGSGGWVGKGLGESLQKQFIPEAQNDMIFSVICEEIGFFGAVIFIGLFMFLLIRLFNAAMKTTDSFGSLLIIGVFAHIAIQVVLNIAVVTNTIPNTGVSLPFVSYGGSSVMFLLIEIGIVRSVCSGEWD